ncbi:uncharacterized protein LOC118562603 [Fundulus heteroclitus]|uniref:uncharacterized protein LOC118562603 n=1 Tax=Fundulus heteroclitus TaxID=8078 RepID=UPI00165A4BE4|nr:uncharacterized protein LOC118562603 [Fundulus heteroclitus]
MELSMGIKSSMEFLRETFPRCSTSYSFTCKETAVDENLICAAVNRSQLQQTLATDNSSTALCSFTITEHACSVADQLAAQSLATLLKCSLESHTTYPVEVWKLFFQKVSPALDEALETFATVTPNNSSPAVSNALDALREARLANLSNAQLQSGTFIGDLVQRNIGPFLASPSTNFLFCLSSYNFSCLTYQIVVKGLSNQRELMNSSKQQAVFTYFIKPFLSRVGTPDAGCTSSTNGSQEWLQANLGGFASFATIQELQTLNPHLSTMDVLDLLTFSQLRQLATMPSHLKGMQDVSKVMGVIQSADFAAFFDTVSPVIEAQSANYTLEVKSTFLQAVLDRGDFSLPAVSDEEFLLWMRVRLRPLLVNLSSSLVKPFFSIGTNRSCYSHREIITVLDNVQMTLSKSTKENIYNNIVLFLQGVKCYSGGSFYLFLKNTFLSFGFPDVSTLISLLPPTRKSELLNTISTSELGQLLSQPGVINNSPDVCIIFSHYNNTATFLQSEDVPDDVRRTILPCVWPLALSSSSRSEVDLWFNVRLKDYLRFLTKELISSTEVQNASCLAFQKL